MENKLEQISSALSNQCIDLERIADYLRDYVEKVYRDSQNDDIVQLIPAPGWFVIFSDEVSCPLAAWGLTRGGDVVPLAPDNNGTVEDVREINGTRIYHESSPVGHYFSR